LVVTPSVGKIVLLVDDNLEILETTSNYLHTRGLHVVTSSSALGVTALVSHHRPDVIVLDVMMPALDGDALASLIRGRKNNTRATPIIFYSAMEEEQLHCLAAGLPGTSYVAKSEGLGALYSAIIAQ
jgi:two-component system, OmpR family, response regulator